MPIDAYVRGLRLGKGAYAVVYAAEEKKTHNRVALKIWRNRDDASDAAYNCGCEAELNKLIHAEWKGAEQQSMPRLRDNFVAGKRNHPVEVFDCV